MDFDGSNMYALVPSIQTLGSLYSEDLNTMYTFSPATAATGAVAAVPARLSVTSLLIEADR
jgi:hypothetical protein